MSELIRPNPDDLLKGIKRAEARQGAGQLTIFLGMSAGVGKTYAMLERAQELVKAKVDLVVGTVNTHGRAETEELLKGLKIIPKRSIEYKDAVFEEFDLDKILQLKPKIVLVDELAHTNVPGSKHLKRWQDVEELLDAGIDVYTTLNVQHIESRKDVVEKITSVVVRETVPDLVLERASVVTLIDIPPQVLLQRLRDGKVYVPNQSALAVKKFFKESHLTALREVALRFTAEKVKHDLHHFSALEKTWKINEKLMVLIDHHSTSEHLIRATRHLAFELDAPWIVLHVNCAEKLTIAQQTKLNRYLQMAQELGAEVVVVDDLFIMHALLRIAREKEVSRFVLPEAKETGFFKNPFKRSLIDKLQNYKKDFDLIILKKDEGLGQYTQKSASSHVKESLLPYVLSVGVVLFVALCAFFGVNYISIESLGVIFLVTNFVLSFFVKIGPLFLAASSTALLWEYLFRNVYNEDHHGLFLLIGYFLLILGVNFLATYIKKRESFYRKREEKMLFLYEIMKEIAKASSFPLLRQHVVSKLKNIFDGEFTLLPKDAQQQLNFNDSGMELLKREKELAAAQWAFTNRKIAGAMTDTLSSSEAIFFPIEYGNLAVGLLVYAPKKRHMIGVDEVYLLKSICDQLGIYLEHFNALEAAFVASKTAQR